MRALSYFVYIVRCEDASLYSGITTDVVRRMGEHLSQSSLAAHYTRTHRVAELVGLWTAPDRSMASKLEYRLHHMGRREKLRMLESPQLAGDPFEWVPDAQRCAWWQRAVSLIGGGGE